MTDAASFDGVAGVYEVAVVVSTASGRLAGLRRHPQTEGPTIAMPYVTASFRYVCP
ncbi:hypothetical protein ACPW96_09585 [Micromonospora sp. DT81.3]|uniref:hypothetical protein n=1 Tax=Micromonospora sp. DT81.3 TaxID=3416523 RepID=UPI003CED9338